MDKDAVRVENVRSDVTGLWGNPSDAESAGLWQDHVVLQSLNLSSYLNFV